MARNREERQRASARRRIETHDSGGGSNYLRLPDGWSLLQAKPGKYRLDFMSYKVTKGKGESGGNPYFEKGELAFERTFFVHRGIGPNQDWHLCAAKTLGEPCPICEHRAKMARDPNADEDVIKELAPKERQLWIPKDLSDPDTNFIMEASFHLFGKQLDAKVKSGDEEDEYEYFADPVDGKTVRVNFEQSDRGKWVEAVDIEFRARRQSYDADIVDEMPDLDEMLVATPYEKLKRLFLQTGEEKQKDDDDDRPTKTSARGVGKSTKAGQKTADDVGLGEGDQVEYEDEVCEIVRVSKDGTSLTLENEDGDVFKAVGVDEVEAVPKKKSTNKKPVPQDDDEDDDWEDDDDVPVAKKSTKKPAKVDDDEDDEPAPKKKSAAPKDEPKKSTKKPASKDDDDDEDWD